MCLRFKSSSSISRATDDEVKRNAEIEKVIRRDKRQQSKNVKILLLGAYNFLIQISAAYFSGITGAGESGKSTILKQMRLIYTEGFSQQERKEVRQVIFANLIVAFKIIAEEMRELQLEYRNGKSKVRLFPVLIETKLKRTSNTKTCSRTPKTLESRTRSHSSAYRQ